MNHSRNPQQHPFDPRSAGLSDEEAARYSRHLILPEVGMEGQQRLKSSRVLVIGAGGLGSPAALYLAAAGVGTIGLADFDRVEVHNLQRQILHRDADIGRPKVESGASALANINPHIAVRVHPEGVTPAHALDLFSSYDLVVDGSDNFPTRYLNADAAHLTGRPLIYGGLFKFEGQVSVFDTRTGGPCYRCLFPESPDSGAVPNCAETGVFGALCGVIGSLQAMEALKLIVGIGQSLSGRLLIMDALDMRIQHLAIRRNPNCPLCSANGSIRTIDAARYESTCPSSESKAPGEEMGPKAVSHHLKSDPDAVILDVREASELAICRIEGAMHIPMSRLSASLDAIPKDIHLFIICHHGHRSLQALRYLNTRGYARTTNIQGGIDAWARAVDPTLRRY